GTGQFVDGDGDAAPRVDRNREVQPHALVEGKGEALHLTGRPVVHDHGLTAIVAVVVQHVEVQDVAVDPGEVQAGHELDVVVEDGGDPVLLVRALQSPEVRGSAVRSAEHTSELQLLAHPPC